MTILSGTQLARGGRKSPLPFFENKKKSSLILKKWPASVHLWDLKCSFKSILDKNYLFCHAKPFYHNMNLIKLSLFQETSTAWKNSWLHACSYKAFITFAAFGNFVPQIWGKFQLGKVSFNWSFFLYAFLCIFYMYIHLELN